ncbi:helix-turn-helix transcriptional regulator [uncultured Brevundimonas sp.]|uniref:helix-turn-helix transcriptional regulator n=1 Tax=uncultured Brevundimonas sp. TaxID=213418 RepID=UPI00345DDE6E
MPDDLYAIIDNPVTGALPPPGSRRDDGIDIQKLRLWSRVGRQLSFAYVDHRGQATRRVVWPFMIGYVGVARVIMAWCELRSDFRVFRLDRMAEIEFLEMRYPVTAGSLRRRWTKRRDEQHSTRGDA